MLTSLLCKAGIWGFFERPWLHIALTLLFHINNHHMTEIILWCPISLLCFILTFLLTLHKITSLSALVSQSGRLREDKKWIHEYEIWIRNKPYPPIKSWNEYFTFFIWKVWLLLCSLPITVLQVLCFCNTGMVLNTWRLYRNNSSCCHVKGRNIGLVLCDNFCGLSYGVTAFPIGSA